MSYGASYEVEGQRPAQCNDSTYKIGYKEKKIERKYDRRCFIQCGMSITYVYRNEQNDRENVQNASGNNDNIVKECRLSCCCTVGYCTVHFFYFFLKH